MLEEVKTVKDGGAEHHSGSEEGEVKVAVKKKSPRKPGSRSSSHRRKRSDSRSTNDHDIAGMR
jgi:hypothetical protein